MRRFPLFVVVLTCLSLVGCGPEEEVDPVEEDEGIQPQAGDWTLVATGWTNDDCNAEENLTGPTSIVVADVEDSSFRVTYFEDGVQVGSNTVCTYDGDDIYDCDDYTNGFSYDDVDASISMTAVGTITVPSETTASGVGDFVLECEGDDCNVVAAQTTSGVFPCSTTFNWSAEAD